MGERAANDVTAHLSKSEGFSLATLLLIGQAEQKRQVKIHASMIKEGTEKYFGKTFKGILK